jgi:hypothetical protein
MGIIMGIFSAAGILCFVLYVLLILIVVFKESILKGILCLFFMLPCCIYFGITRRSKLKGNWKLLILGTALFIVACIIDLLVFKGKGIS